MAIFKKPLKGFIPNFLISCYHFLWAFFSALVFGFPSRKLTVIGITGTNGKTTTANLAADILETAGYKVAAASSIKFKIGSNEKENKLKMTMPGRGVLQKFLRDAVRANCQYVIIEATSEGVLQHRHRFVGFKVMVFTNLSPEHIERHGSFENYRKAKGEYFRRCKGVHIVNLDDGNVDYFLRFPADKKIGFSTNKNHLFVKGLTEKKVNARQTKNQYGIHAAPPFLGDEAMLTGLQIVAAENIEEKGHNLIFVVQNVCFMLPLMGRFNVYNALAAICVGLSQNVSLELCQKALAKSAGVPGRMEKVISQPFRVVVDYAFTPNALEQVYKTLSPEPKTLSCPTSQNIAGERPETGGHNPKLICVLGACGGGRDKWKRPVLGEIAAKYCQEIIITNEDPYDEPPMDIINQVSQGIKMPSERPGSLGVRKILDRRKAIYKALELARPGDTVIITGKGCEPWLCVERGKKIPWDDRQVVREEFAKIQKNFYPQNNTKKQK